MTEESTSDDKTPPESRRTDLTVVFDMEEWKSRALLVLIALVFPTMLFFAFGFILWGLVFYGCIALVVLGSYYIIRKYPNTRPLFGYVETQKDLPEAADLSKWTK